MIVLTPELSGFCPGVKSAENRILRALPINPITIGNLVHIDFSSNRAFYYYLVLGVVAITLLILYRIEHSRLGRILKSIEKSELLAKSIGIDTIWFKLAAFCICSFFLRSCLKLIIKT